MFTDSPNTLHAHANDAQALKTQLGPSGAGPNWDTLGFLGIGAIYLNQRLFQHHYVEKGLKQLGSQKLW